MNIVLPYNWQARQYQKPLLDYMLPDKKGLRACCLWHRRAGKDLTAINITAIKAFQRVGQYWHLLPYAVQGRDVIWDGMTKEGRRFIDFFPPQMISRKLDQEMKLEFLNGSIWRVAGADNFNRLVGTNPVGVVFSEYSVHTPYKDAWDYIRPILRENGGWALFIYTVRGRNHAWDLYKFASDDPAWFAELLVAGDHGTKDDSGNPIVSDAMIEEERRSGMAEELIQQEFYNSPDAGQQGSYYSDLMNKAHAENRVTGLPWDQSREVHTAWDLGFDDQTAIWFWQENGMNFDFIDYYEVAGQYLQDLIATLKKKPYVYGNHWAPFDMDKEEWGAAANRLDIARKLGVRFRISPRHRIGEGIAAVRSVMWQCRFDRTKCRIGIECLRNYKKAYDRRAGMFKERPEHDKYSHGADAFRIFATRGITTGGVFGGRARQARVLDNWK